MSNIEDLISKKLNEEKNMLYANINTTFESEHENIFNDEYLIELAKKKFNVDCRNTAFKSLKSHSMENLIEILKKLDIKIYDGDDILTFAVAQGHGNYFNCVFYTNKNIYFKYRRTSSGSVGIYIECISIVGNEEKLLCSISWDSYRGSAQLNRPVSYGASPPEGIDRLEEILQENMQPVILPEIYVSYMQLLPKEKVYSLLNNITLYNNLKKEHEKINKRCIKLENEINDIQDELADTTEKYIECNKLKKDNDNFIKEIEKEMIRLENIGKKFSEQLLTEITEKEKLQKENQYLKNKVEILEYTRTDLEKYSVDIKKELEDKEQVYNITNNELKNLIERNNLLHNTLYIERVLYICIILGFIIYETIRL